LGRLLPEYFPKIFGKSEKEPLDIEASQRAFEQVQKEVNNHSSHQMSLDEIAYGCELFYMLQIVLTAIL
jgi:5-oxoprolinase (ATP-hydrolysing)